jgi:hypothetical protein
MISPHRNFDRLWGGVYPRQVGILSLRDREAIQLDRHGVLRTPANEHARFVITSPTSSGVVIQPDGHGAERLAMTLMGFIRTHHASGRCCISRDDNHFSDMR